jgi:hypothetical protein
MCLTLDPLQQVPTKRESLNDGDVFILDTGFTIYMFAGTKSSRQERAKGATMCQNIKDHERKGKPKIIILQEGNHLTSAAMLHFLSLCAKNIALLYSESTVFR